MQLFLFWHFRNTQVDFHIEYVNFLMRKKYVLANSYSNCILYNFFFGVTQGATNKR